MGTIGTLPSRRLAGLSADLFHKLQSGNLTENELALFVQRKNPFTFERNEHGHIVLTFDGIDLAGAKEDERLTAAGFRVSHWAKSCLLSTKNDGYDKNHHLLAGQSYKVALMPTQEIELESNRTTYALCKRGIEKYAYVKPLAGIVPRIRETVSDKQMEEIGFWYIAAPHDPIKDSGGDPHLLHADRSGWLGAPRWGRPDSRWSDGGAVAFLVPAS